MKSDNRNEQLRHCFQDTLNQIESIPELSCQTANSIKHTKVYKERHCTVSHPCNKQTEIIVEENTTFCAAHKHRIHQSQSGETIIGKTAVLNFANPHYPGGGVARGGGYGAGGMPVPKQQPIHISACAGSSRRFL